MEQPAGFVVFVDDNYHYQDQSYRYRLGSFATCAEATAACKSIVDEFLADAYKRGMSADELYKHYTGFGEDPYIYSRECRFSAWTYARERCAIITNQQ